MSRAASACRCGVRGARAADRLRRVRRAADRARRAFGSAVRVDRCAARAEAATRAGAAAPAQAPRIAKFLEPEIAAGLVAVRAADRSVIVLRGDGVFKSGSTSVIDRYVPVLARVADALNKVPGNVRVTGYTDDTPVHTARFASNWDLSRERAKPCADDRRAARPSGTARRGRARHARSGRAERFAGEPRTEPARRDHAAAGARQCRRRASATQEPTDHEPGCRAFRPAVAVAEIWTFAGLVVLACFVWLAGPLFAFAEVRPLESGWARGLTIAVLLIAWGARVAWRSWRAGRLNAQLLNQLREAAPGPAVADDPAKAQLDELRSRFDEAATLLKKVRFGQADTVRKGLPRWFDRMSRQYLYQLPWYVFIGAPGKTTALVNSASFPLAEQFGRAAIRGVGGTRHCDWWFTNDAVLIDTAGRYTTHEGNRALDEAEWKGFVDLLKKYRTPAAERRDADDQRGRPARCVGSRTHAARDGAAQAAARTARAARHPLSRVPARDEGRPARGLRRVFQPLRPRGMRAGGVSRSRSRKARRRASTCARHSTANTGCCTSG